VVDLKSTMARSRLVATPAQPDPRNEIEYLAWFRFPVTWTYLNSPLPEVEPQLPGKPVSPPTSAAMTLVTTMSAPTAMDTASIVGDARPAGSAAQWEMVIPKMVRPPARPLANHRPAALAAPASAPIPARPDSISATGRDQAPVPSVPLFTPLLLITPDDKFLVRFWRQIALAVLAVVAIGFLLWGRSGPSPSVTRQRTIESSSMAGWSRSSLSPPGRLMSVYEPSRDESDYRIEFGWVPDAKGVGWVFRTLDAGSYYATRLTLLQPGVNLVLAAEHFSVIGGAESAHSRKVIRLANNTGLVRVRMDAIGPAFTLSLQDSPVDYWADPRLNSGALGFYDERGQRPEVQALRFTFIKKGATRTAVASLP
jgi:hypothetical protein